MSTPGACATTARRIATGAVLGTLGFLIIAPLWAILARALSDTAAYFDLVGSPRIHRIVSFTVEQTAISVVLALALGIPIALLGCWRVPFSRVAITITTATFVLPTMVVAAAWRALAVPNGLLAITTAHAYFNVSVIVRFVTDAHARIPKERFDVARTLGAGPFGMTRWVILPGVRRAIFTAAAVVAAFSATSLGIVTALAAQRQGTIETEILRRATSVDALPSAAWLGILQLVLIAPLLLIVIRQRTLVGSRTDDLHVPRLGHMGRLIGGVAAVGVIVIWCLPLVQLLRSATWGQLDRIALAVSGGSLTDAIAGSVRAAALATPLAIGFALALVLIRSRAATAIRGLSLLALGISPALLGLGMLLAYRVGFLDLRTSPLLIPIAQSLVALPFCIRLISDAHASIPADRIAMARALGCSRTALIRFVEWPALARTTLSAAGFAAVIALGDFSATTFIARPDQPTLPLLIQRCFSRPGTAARGTGIAVACVLLGLCGVAFGLTHVHPLRRSAAHERWVPK